MRKRLKYDDTLQLRFARPAQGLPVAELHDETDDEAEELGAVLAAAREERRQAFCSQAARCFEALPEPLRDIFGAARMDRRTSNGRLELQDCLRQFSTVDVIEDDFSPSYSCAACRGANGRDKTFASRRYWLWPGGLPPTLTLQLKRFRKTSAEFVKSNAKVALPATLDLGDCCVLRDTELHALAAHDPDVPSPSAGCSKL